MEQQSPAAPPLPISILNRDSEGLAMSAFAPESHPGTDSTQENDANHGHQWGGFLLASTEMVEQHHASKDRCCSIIFQASIKPPDIV
jgi:hypothetical protein